MSTIAADRVVSLHYTLRNDAGDTIDSSRGGAPLVYLHGADNIVPGLENRLEGRAVGDRLTVVVPPAEGYGEREGPGPQAVPRAAFGDSDLEEGMAVLMEDEDGNEVPLWIVEIVRDEIFVDTNHPLAGLTLHFEVEVMEVRDATEEELSHGHVHDGDDHHHH
jgi:FKBP-type peptidyl-prolyl cis-trans isomerase SlyD